MLIAIRATSSANLRSVNFSPSLLSSPGDLVSWIYLPLLWWIFWVSVSLSYVSLDVIAGHIPHLLQLFEVLWKDLYVPQSRTLSRNQYNTRTAPSCLFNYLVKGMKMVHCWVRTSEACLLSSLVFIKYTFHPCLQYPSEYFVHTG